VKVFVTRCSILPTRLTAHAAGVSPAFMKTTRGRDAGVRRVAAVAAAALIVLACAVGVPRQALTWESAATRGDVAMRVREPAAIRVGDALPTIVYLKNLSIPRLGRDSDDVIVADLRAAGFVIVEVDYAHHARAISAGLQADVLKLRRDIAGKKLLGERPIDLARVLILPEGFRLKRDVEFARDGARVLAMDIMYPSHPAKPVPALMEITCDNANRMGTGSLVFCHDTLLEGAMFAGFAAAMVDHPVAPPYKGLDDPMPELIHRLKAAVRTLRATGEELGFNAKIGAMGFSRGSNMAALLATTGGRADLEGDDATSTHAGVSSRIQAALIHGGRFDYTRLRPDDPMLARFEKAWGKREDNAERWAAHGAAHYLSRGEGERAVPPMFLNTSDAEAVEFRDQLARFAERLKEAGVPHVYVQDADGRGHRVSTDPKTLSEIYGFFAKYLN
jgi:acetyl esterase/lipase